MPTVTIVDDDQTIEITKPCALIDLCDHHDTSILFGCRDAACGACMITVLDGHHNLSTMQDDERDLLRSIEADANARLACQCTVEGNVTIAVPQ